MVGRRRPGVAPNYARRRLGVVLAIVALATGAVVVLTGEDPREPLARAELATPATTLGDAATSSTEFDARNIAPTDVFVVAPGTGPVVGTGSVHTYTVEVEQGIPVDVVAVAAEVDRILADPRGWTAAGDVSLRRVGPGDEPELRVRLATAATTDAHCAPLDTHGEQSCRNGMDVMINVIRWVEGAAPSQLPVERYREYVISHEVGHALGHDHVGCPSPGQVAPVMLQQTLGLEGCTPNPWPFP